VFDQPRDIVRQGVADRAFPAAAVEVGSSTRVRWRYAHGTLTYEPGSAVVSDRTVFDLASLTKVIATTSVALGLCEAGVITLDQPVARWLPEWSGLDRVEVSIRDLLEHASGLPGYLALYERCQGRRDYLAEIGRWPLEYGPRSTSIYSDLGFIALGCLLERAGGVPLDQLAESRIHAGDEGPEGLPLRFNPPAAWRHHTAPTEVDPWRGRLLVGEVHDENAWALGGVAGHAGLFGTAAAVGHFARKVLRAWLGVEGSAGRFATIDSMRLFTTRSSVPGSSRALGWDTMLPTSSCGTRMSPSAFGHAGFTGTTLWIDPARDLYAVFLTNRVHPSRDNLRITAIRPLLHDAIVECVDR
jgi:CubicO group peptidase (beta-lactamase class C family)